MKPFLILALTALFVGQLHAQTGTKDDPLPSDREIEASGGQARDEKFWRLLPSNEQKATGIARFTFRFQTYPAPDSFDIYYGKDHIYSTGGLVTVPYNDETQSDARTVNLEVPLRSSTLVRVVVNKVANSEPNTNWKYSIQSRLASLTDLNDSSEIKEGGSAFITGSNPPLMPKLVANVRFPDPGSKVRWRMVVKYGTQTVRVPASGKFTKKLNATAPWNIYENYVNAKGDDLGFFGGKGTLFFQVDNTRVDTLDFTIAGKNPDDTDVRSYIDSITSSPIAYPAAKAETFGYCGVGSLYNQFYDESSDIGGPTPKITPGYPVRAAVKGYGIFQLSRLTAVSRSQRWNWQSNVAEGIWRLTGDSLQGVTHPINPKPAVITGSQLLADLARTYPTAPSLPDVSYPAGEGTQTINAANATTLIAYDGFQGCPTIRVKTEQGGFKQRRSCWTYDETAQQWTFHDNKRSFVQRTVAQIETAQSN